MIVLSFNKAHSQVPTSIFLEHHVKPHIERVQNVGEQVYLMHRELFPDLNQKLVRDFLQLHDLPKLMELKALKGWGFKGDRPMYLDLANAFGKRLDPRIIDELNRIEAKMKTNFFSQQSLKSYQKWQLLRLEHIVDITDTGIKRTREMPNAHGAYNGRAWLESEGLSKKWLNLSVWIENNYRILTTKGFVCRGLFQ